MHGVYLGTFVVVMEPLDCQVAAQQMKDEWKFVNLGNGKQFVTTTGVRMKRELCAGNWDIVIKVHDKL